MLDFVIITALSISGLLFCLKKWGVLTWYQVYRKAWMPPADCYFCMSFWLVFWFSWPFCPVKFSPGLDLDPNDLYVFVWRMVGYVAIAALSAFICSVIIEPERT